MIATTTHSNRQGLKSLMVAKLDSAAGLADVDVRYSAPIGSTEVECVFLGDMKGAITHATMRAGRKSSDDRPTLDIYILVQTNGDTDQGVAADQRSEAIFDALYDLMMEDPGLGSDVAGMLWCEFGASVEGPDTRPWFNDKGEQLGWQSMWTCPITFRSRYD